MARYGKAFKDKELARLFLPESAAMQEGSLPFSISVSTLDRWSSEATSSKNMSPPFK
jgi:hypothetical protein